jgi:signal recognition particle subunit SRP54
LFGTLTHRIQAVFRELSRHGKLSERDVDEALGELRRALLEADVHFSLVKGLLEGVRERALSEEVARALNPSQQVLKALFDGLVSNLGEPVPFRLTGQVPRRVLLVGLQGSGKTTTAGKLAAWFRKEGERVWLVAADVQRPAAIEQLQILGDSLTVPVYHEAALSAPEVAAHGLKAARKAGATLVIVDSAGRSQLDDDMMDELAEVHQALTPNEVILVADSMTGQEAVGIAQGFSRRLKLTGLILTKLDGDARGGAAISMRAVSGVPIKFIGTGEKLQDLEVFDASRLASRILGMGDVVGLLEKAEARLDVSGAEDQIRRLTTGEFDLHDFAQQLAQVRRMGPLGKLLDMLPAGAAMSAPGVDPQEAEARLARTAAIIDSMTPAERRNPKILNASRKRRVAKGSGTTVQQVNQTLRQYQQMRKVFQTLGKRGLPNLPGIIR